MSAKEVERIFSDARSTKLDDYFNRDRSANKAICKHCGLIINKPLGSKIMLNAIQDVLK